MSDTVKLIIEIDETTYKDIKKGKVYSSMRDVPQESVLAIAHGIPLDDVKAEIEYNAEIHEDGECYLMEQWVYDALDGKYRAESEE